MRLLVDADSLGTRLREVIAKAAGRRSVQTVFVANKSVRLPPSEYVRMIVADDADDWIVEHADAGDLAITRDIPLAARLAELDVVSITDRGDRLDKTNIALRLSERRFAMELREAGGLDSRGKPYGARELTAFANALDRELTARTSQTQ